MLKRVADTTGVSVHAQATWFLNDHGREYLSAILGDSLREPDQAHNEAEDWPPTCTICGKEARYENPLVAFGGDEANLVHEDCAQDPDIDDRAVDTAEMTGEQALTDE